MGIFDNLKKTALNQIVNAVEKSVTGSSHASNSSQGNYQKSSPAPQSSARPVSHSGPSGKKTNQKFDEIFASEFSGLQIMREASPESIGIKAPAPCRPYSYALLRDGKAVVAIMLTDHNRDRNSAFLNARKSALDSKVTFLNFYTHCPNERNYVVSRIKNAL